MPLNWESVSGLIDIVASVIVILGVPTGLFQYFRNTKRERINNEYSAYNTTDQSYMDFLKICFENPQLDIFDIPDRSPAAKLSPTDSKKELIAFTMLICIFERAYFIYENAPSGVVSRQWGGWKEYIADYCRRPNFQNAWKHSGSQFDEDFQKFMQDIMDNILKTTKG